MKGPVFSNFPSLGNLKYSDLVFISYTRACRASSHCGLDWWESSQIAVAHSRKLSVNTASCPEAGTG